ncbi:MAG: protein translocase subunit SecD [Alphaproteobacteria bacterium]|nr:protein translocase subunit SecD [Alphaproteobacteria bacterium]
MLYFAPWKIVLVGLTCLLGVLFALPNLLPANLRADLPGFLPRQTVNLGLDLQGGTFMLLEVDVEAVFTERLDALQYALRDTYRDGRVLHRRSLSGGVLTVHLNDPAQMEEALARARDLNETEQTARGPQRTFEIEQPDASTIVITLTDVAKDVATDAALEQSLEVVRRRIDELGTREPSIQRQGRERILVQVPGLDDPDQLRAILGKTAKMSFHLVRGEADLAEALQGRVPADSLLLPQVDTPGEAQVLVERRVRLSGDRLVDASPSFDQQTGEAIVLFQFDPQGARTFGRLTADNVGQRFAIVLDDEVISAPVIREPIPGGRGQISGNFTTESANELAILLRSGALPAPMSVEQQGTVGAELGQDSIRAGQMAAVIGLLAVVVFMVMSYGLFGIFANLALAMNIVLILGALSLMQSTLTLPGIAGIVLTIGMAVDANVLVFERIREELASGKSPINAIDAGFRRAMGTILDANITTLIAAVILFWMGSGPVRGFAVTLGIGILTSVFTAVVLCRLIVVLWIRKRRLQTVPI